jgi:hypothetical protein
MIDFRIKDLFFDRGPIVRAVEKARRAVLSKAGAFIRTTARNSMRRRKGSAPPGQPPHVHKGTLRRLIFFGYDRSSDSVVVGPVGFRASTAPNLLEFGGKATLVRRRRGKVVRDRATYESRPFMGPALEKERPRLPQLWAGSVRGG